MPLITLPNDWTPRPYQLPVLQYLDGGGKQAVSVWARRHGKDSTAINYTAKAAFQRVGTYWHVYPTLRQARKAIWDGIDRQGRRIIHQAFPGANDPDAKTGIVQRVREDDMKIELIPPPGQTNGSIWQLVGADNHDALVGSNPVGVVLSEWSLMDPKTYDFISPILAENGGWAWFIYTPRGKNHGYKILQTAIANPDTWHHDIVDIRKGGVLDVEATLARERARGMPEELIQQEYFCSFDIGSVGTVFAQQIEQARNSGRISDVPYDPNFPVETAWDLGVRDATAVWFIQRVGVQVRAIDYFEVRNKGLDYAIGVINSKPYVYNRHIAPFDIGKPEGYTGKTLRETAANFGFNFEIAPKLPLADGINAARALISRTIFDQARTAEGVKALENYKYEWDEDKDIFTKEPVHDWASHGSSAFRYYAVMPELDYMMPDWLKQMSPIFGGRVPAGKEWNPRTARVEQQTQDWSTVPKADPLAAFRGR